MFKKIKQLLSKKDNNDTKELKNLSELFINSPEEGISQAKQYLMAPNFTNYDDFIEDVKKTQKSSTCIVSWSKSMLSARCLDCQLKDNSCICIPCYLAGKHDQHHSYLLGGSGAGNCDCGDPNFWKPEGNCPHHPGPDPNPEVTQMTADNRTKFIKVFEIAYNAALTLNDDQFSIQILDWISSFISFGDGLRRCVAIAVSTSPEKLFLSKLCTLQKPTLISLLDLFGKITSDHFFSERMGSFTLKKYLFLRDIIKTELVKETFNKKALPFYPTKKYLNFSFHFFSDTPLMYLINECKFNWVSFILDCIKFTFQTLKEINMDYDKNQEGQITSQLWYLSTLLEVLMKKDDQHDNIQRFIDSYSSLLLEYERFFSFTFPRKKGEDNHAPFSSLFLFIYIYQINSIFSPQFEASQKNKTFSLKVTFSNLVKYLTSQKDIRPMSIFGKEPCTLSSFLPLHHLFYCLLSSHKNPKLTINDLCKSRKIPVNKFCLLSSICPLRFLATIFVKDRFNLLNQATRRHITYCIDKPEETFNMFFGLVQTNLSSIEGDFDDFLSLIVETFGVFDDYQTRANFSSDNRTAMYELMDYQKQLEMREMDWFDASVLIVSLLSDKSISTFDKVLFKRLRVIEFLTFEKPSAKDIENYVSDKLSNPIFGDDLQSFAERVSTSNGSFFRLKEEQSEFTPFFPMIDRKNRIKIIMKYNEKLIPIPEFSLKISNDLSSKLFMSPTYIAAMYRCIVDKSVMVKQIGLAMFVLSAKNGPKYDFKNDFENPKSISPDSIADLITSIKNYFISSTTFNPLLLKIELPETEDKKSIIDEIQLMESLGYEALLKTDLPDFLRPKLADNKEEIEKEKKMKAANLKQALMKEFQNKRSQFTMGGPKTTTTNEDDDDYNDDDLNDFDACDRSQSVSIDKIENGEILCNICQTKVEDDILGFPCLSLPCIFPSLINNKLHNLSQNIDDFERVFSLSICLHHVHKRCCMSLIKEFKDDRGTKNSDHIYQCMIDRGTRNCFLPLFDESIDFGDEQSEALLEAVDSFFNSAFVGLKIEENFIVLIKSYAGAVLTVEVRHRSRPECLDNPTVPALLHNFLFAIYTRLHNKVSIDSRNVSDPLEKLVSMLIISESPRSEYKNFVKEISATMKDDDYLYEFLRRSAIIEDFALKGEIQKSSENKKEKFIDWDEILSFENLVKRYEIVKENCDEIELPLFETIPLAERFVSLYQPPYNMDIFDSSFSKFVDLLTGKIVFFSKTDIEIPGKPDIPHVTFYVSEKYHEGVAMFLGLTGPNASDIIISCPKIAKLFNLDGFYVDQFGDIDRGFKRGAILSLSKDRLENALDKLLSGDVILY